MKTNQEDPELREKIGNIDRTFSIGNEHYEEFLLPSYYLDRLVDFVSKNYLPKETLREALKEEKPITPQTHQTARGSLDILCKQHEEMGYNEAKRELKSTLLGENDA